jgi:hypothetical protein
VQSDLNLLGMFPDKILKIVFPGTFYEDVYSAAMSSQAGWKRYHGKRLYLREALLLGRAQFSTGRYIRNSDLPVNCKTVDY